MKLLVGEGNCSDAEHIYTDAWFIVTQFSIVIINTIGLTFCSCLCFFILISQLFHINLRILLTNLYGAMALRTICTSFRSASSLWAAFTYSDPCAFLHSSEHCALNAAICALPLSAVLDSFLAIAVERIIALLFYCKYERLRIPLVALILVPATWVRATVTLVDSLSTSSPKHKMMAYCSSLVATTTFNLARLLDVTLPLLILSAFTFAIIHIVCTIKLRLHLSRSVENLSARYQLRENVRSTKLFATASVLYSIIMATNITIYAFLAASNTLSLKTIAILKEASSLVSIPIFMLIWSFLFLRMMPYFRERILRLIFRPSSPFRFRHSAVSFTLSTAHHMTILNATWAGQTRNLSSKLGIMHGY
ncbi:Serpentine receptor class alpha/beta-14 [Toxocara canis]|uniref:Serpentine receptor class alpha/beta-14 n=1 Tax=Toxocara canis TaxID=6265 RepID=A0A0B2V6J3_TOXCA|nr:Serpentine receptor class alpha/beta-14 [Toxocara canis]